MLELTGGSPALPNDAGATAFPLALKPVGAHQPAHEAEVRPLTHAQKVVIFLVADAQCLQHPDFFVRKRGRVDGSGVVDVRRHNGVFPFLVKVEHLFYFRINDPVMSSFGARIFGL